MKNTKEVILFYKGTINYDLERVSKEIESRFEDLKNPIISKSEGLIVFNNNDNFQIEINNKNVIIVMKYHYFNELTSIVFDVIDAFETYDVKFSRIGYISSNFESPLKIDAAKKKFLKEEEFNDVLELNLNWYRKLDFDSSYINCWERVITDSTHFKDLLLQYDINTRNDENIEFDMKFIKKFFKTADTFVESRIDSL